jgi:hypothetical protein
VRGMRTPHMDGYAFANASSRCFFYFFEEKDVRLVNHASLLHCSYQILRSGKISSLAQIIPFKQDYKLIRVIRIAKELRLFGATSLSSGSMLIVNGLPLDVIHNFVPNEHVWHIITFLDPFMGYKYREQNTAHLAE